MDAVDNDEVLSLMTGMHTANVLATSPASATWHHSNASPV